MHTTPSHHTHHTHTHIHTHIQVILAPVQFAIGKISGELRRRTISVTDERIGLMDEILSSIKLIKLCVRVLFERALCLRV